MSNRGRRIWNKVCGQIARPGEAPSVARLSRTREEVIVGIVLQECGSSSNLAADDFASDIILELWESKKFGEDFDAIREHVRGGIRKAIRKQGFAEMRFISDSFGRDGKPVPLDVLVDRERSTKPMQEISIMAIEAVALAMALPRKQRDALLTLGDGGNPIDVANEMGIEPWDAISLIREARVNVHRVDGLAA